MAPIQEENRDALFRQVPEVCPLRIAYLAVDVDIDLPRGSATHTIEVAMGLKKLGNDVRIFARRGDMNQRGVDELEEIPIRRIYRGMVVPLRETHTTTTASSGGTSFLKLLYAIYLRTIYALYCTCRIILDLRDEKPDFILERGSCLGVGALVSALLDKPMVLEVIDPNHSRISIRRAIGTLAYTRRVLKTDIPPDRLHLVEAAVSARLFLSDRSGRVEKEPDSFTVGYVGIFETWHGIETIVESARYIGDRPFVYLMVGPGYERIEGEIDDDLVGMFHFTGGVKREDVPRMISAMDVALAPFLETGPGMGEKGYYFSPLKIFEYAACGKPIIASDLALIRRSMPYSLFVRPGDAQDLASALVSVYEERVRARRMGKRAQELVKSVYSWERFSEDLLSVFDRWRGREGV